MTLIRVKILFDEYCNFGIFLIKKIIQKEFNKLNSLNLFEIQKMQSFFMKKFLKNIKKSLIIL